MWIALSGIDGSGKSTISSLLAQRINEAGRPAVYSRPAYRNNELLKRFALDTWGDPYAYIPGLPPDTYLIALTMDWLDWHVCHEEECRALDRLVVSDRGPMDVRAQAIAYGANLTHVNQLLAFLGRPDQQIVLTVDLGVAWRRLSMRDVPPHALEAPHRLEEMAQALGEAARISPGATAFLDAGQPVDVLLDELMPLVEKCMAS